MASSKTLARPLTQHRQSISSGSMSSLGPARPMSHSRNNSHAYSTLSGAINATHRVTRRKSMTNSAANAAAVAAALEEAGDKVTPLPIAVNSRRGTMSKSALSRSAIVGSLPSPPASLPTHKFSMSMTSEGPENAIDDDSNDMSADEGDAELQKARIRRASDGQPLTKEGKKSNRVELRCDKCGKGYKHSSCLTKHLWEHTPEWSLTSKLLISKHQQVQLLEAASVLVAMNNKDVTTPPDSAKDFTSETDSVSPTTSGYSDPHDSHGSADTTPPPHPEAFAANALAYRTAPKRSSNGSVYSRSYQSAASGTFLPSSFPNGSGFGHYRQASSDRRPPSSGANNTGKDDRDLAAAVELLSCSISSNGGSRDVRLPNDAPPVPPLPPQYLDHTAFASTSFINSYQSGQMPESFTRGELRQTEDVKMEDSESSIMDEDEGDRRWGGRSSEEDDDMMFGCMED
ncbi:hypothetical protein GGS23DRAFT_324975 [Durotheca rogersii]|uniref:uncharacterized protein n=1 Tax=Durotheca rogersii TaxID=419775 RepID=UPI00221FF748|nr:uncharacterized protein GGS23DRAFT_324975 [Durotheca rogersii]KAI5859383.1 hypothetical protein GGS23DRAFT_324975 [Durotheca rogersii]